MKWPTLFWSALALSHHKSPWMNPEVPWCTGEILGIYLCCPSCNFNHSSGFPALTEGFGTCSPVWDIPERIWGYHISTSQERAPTVLKQVAAKTALEDQNIALPAALLVPADFIFTKSQIPAGPTSRLSLVFCLAQDNRCAEPSLWSVGAGTRLPDVQGAVAILPRQLWSQAESAGLAPAPGSPEFWELHPTVSNAWQEILCPRIPVQAGSS